MKLETSIDLKMVTSYYIMKMLMNKKTIDMEEYYSNLHNMPLPVINNNINRRSRTNCRVCLQDGDMPITNDHEITEALNIFCNIEIVDFNENLTYLCCVCCKFLNSAILFRKIAHRTNETLRQPGQPLSPDHLGDYDHLRMYAVDQSNQTYFTEDFDCQEEPEDGTKVQCPICNELFSKSSYQSHLQVHNLNLKESKEQLSFKQLPNHLRDHEYLGPFKETFDNTKPNKICSTKVPKEDSTKVQCPICKELVCKLSYKIHLQLHNQNLTDQNKESRKVQIEPKIENKQCPVCPICKKVFTEKYFKKHLEIHNPDPSVQYVCDICGKTFKVKNVYVSHRRRHATGNIFKCKLCPYVSRYRDNLRRHMRIHTGKLKYLCTECPARYEFGESLTCHIRLKHTEPQYKCESCDKAFHNNLNLQRHIDAAHLGVKNHVCNICGVAFGYRDYMLKHQRQVHKRAILKQIFTKSTYKHITNN